VVKQKHLLQQPHQHVNQHVVENRLHLPMLKIIHQLMKHPHHHHHNVQNVKQQHLLKMLLQLVMKQIQPMMFMNKMLVEMIIMQLKVKQSLHHHQVENAVQRNQLHLPRKKRVVKILLHQPMM
jgi:hypothetical protein